MSRDFKVNVDNLSVGSPIQELIGTVVKKLFDVVAHTFISLRGHVTSYVSNRHKDNARANTILRHPCLGVIIPTLLYPNISQKIY